jgi:uncharacterized membrane protein YphA (DoxX/SURF4 family)
MDGDFMSRRTIFSRFLLGIIFLVTGFNGFFHFFQMPMMPERAMSMINALGASGYFFVFLKSLEVLCGLLLVMDLYVPLALIILAPIVSNILMFHFFLAPNGLLLPLVIALLMVYLSFFSKSYSKSVKQLFRQPIFEEASRKKLKAIHVS